MYETLEIEQLEKMRVDALLSADCQALGEYFADDTVWIHSSGRLDDKAALLHLLGTSIIDFRKIQSHDVSIRLFGTTAVVDGRVSITAVIAGEQREMNNRFVVVWSRSPKAWQVVHWQSTALADH